MCSLSHPWSLAPCFVTPTVFCCLRGLISFAVCSSLCLLSWLFILTLPWFCFLQFFLGRCSSCIVSSSLSLVALSCSCLLPLLRFLCFGHRRTPFGCCPCFVSHSIVLAVFHGFVASVCFQAFDVSLHILGYVSTRFIA